MDTWRAQTVLSSNHRKGFYLGAEDWPIKKGKLGEKQGKWREGCLGMRGDKTAVHLKANVQDHGGSSFASLLGGLGGVGGCYFALWGSAVQKMSRFGQAAVMSKAQFEGCKEFSQGFFILFSKVSLCISHPGNWGASETEQASSCGSRIAGRHKHILPCAHLFICSASSFSIWNVLRIKIKQMEEPLSSLKQLFLMIKYKSAYEEHYSCQSSG